MGKDACAIVCAIQFLFSWYSSTRVTGLELSTRKWRLCGAVVVSRRPCQQLAQRDCSSPFIVGISLELVSHRLSLRLVPIHEPAEAHTHPRMVLKITLCSTPASIALAVSALSIHSVILVECIGKELGKPGCVLSIISLCDSLAEQVFLIDVLAFPSSPNHCISQSSTTPPSIPRPHPALSPLLALLSLPHITKVFFDGRPDVLELLLAYGPVLANVLDLQLVEVAARVHKCKPGRPDPDLIKHSFKSISAEVERNPSAYAGIHTLRGLEHVVGMYNLLPKDSDTKELKNCKCPGPLITPRSQPHPVPHSRSRRDAQVMQVSNVARAPAPRAPLDLRCAPALADRRRVRALHGQEVGVRAHAHAPSSVCSIRGHA